MFMSKRIRQMHLSEEGVDAQTKELGKHLKSDFIEVDRQRNVSAVNNFGQLSVDAQWQQLHLALSKPLTVTLLDETGFVLGL